MIEVAVENRKPVRIGVNWGSLDSALLTRMMDENSRAAGTEGRARGDAGRHGGERRCNRREAAERHGLAHDQIILSAKVSGVQDLIDVYRALAAVCDYPLHLGLTEAGMGSKGIVATTAALAPVLQDGIGDTIRTSLTPLPNGDRTEEVIVSQQILQSLGIRSFTPQVTACPGCGRTTSTFFQEMADQIQTYLREQMPKWKATPSGRGDHESGGDGLRGERAGRIQALQYRNLAAGHVRGTESAGVRGWPPDDHPEGRPHRVRIHRDFERLRGFALRGVTHGAAIHSRGGAKPHPARGRVCCARRSR